MGSITIDEIAEDTEKDTHVRVVIPIEVEDTSIKAIWYGLVPKQHIGSPWPPLQEAIMTQIFEGRFDGAKFYIAREGS